MLFGLISEAGATEGLNPPANVQDADFVQIQPGTFWMGSPEAEQQRWPDETLHEVRITQGFEMQTTEVTQAQWEAAMHYNPAYFRGANRPVECISYDDIQSFLSRLNAQAVNRGYRYRLPTEAEWEYAARAGTQTAFSFGEDASLLDKYAVQNRDSTAPVGSKLPNPWGLYDMHGNVFEWASDWYGRDYYRSSPTDDPQGPASGSYRVLRGHNWYASGWFLRSAERHYTGKSLSDQYGFRLVMTRL